MLRWRRLMPRLGARKLYYLIQPDLQAQGIKLGRDGLFRYLRAEGLLVKPRKTYTKTTNSRHWLRKHPNLLKEKVAETPEEVLSVILPMYRQIRVRTICPLLRMLVRAR